MKRVLALMIAMMLVLTSSALAINTDGGKYYADYSSMEQAQAEAAKLGEELGEEGVPQVRNEDIYIKEIKSMIYASPQWLNDIKLKAEAWNVSLDSAVTRDAIWYYNQHKSE